ncbi:hypothetical protein AJ78_04804 [Emergomyces pasteurianus Ep9510]|uniref:Swi5-domain-containing protein n=1 Tax=Emergomyces pasteurianus Ep9510 TaxID=1447872 RepID=A0A1J9PE95_9EURO|nr:hypothetical protein AJ78_04804 [Emergomyces pasteurianus Ep9510]
MAHTQNHTPVKSSEQPASSQQSTTPLLSNSISKPEPESVVLTTPTRYSEKHERMIKTLSSKISTLNSEILKTEALLSEAHTKLNPPNIKAADTDGNTDRDTAAPKDPAAIVQRHIRLLHEYNEIKDIGQGLMGLVAEARGVRHVDVQREFGVGDGD